MDFQRGAIRQPDVQHSMIPPTGSGLVKCEAAYQLSGECSCGRILLRGLSTQFGRKRCLLPVSRLLPAKLNRPLFRLCPKLLPSLPLSRPRKRLPFRTAGAQNASDRHCSCGNIDVVSEFTSRSSQEIVAGWADEICSQPHSARAHMKSLGLRFRDEGQATRKSTRVRCGNGWNAVAIRVARVVGCATTYIRIWVIARCCNANLPLRHQ